MTPDTEKIKVMQQSIDGADIEYRWASSGDEKEWVKCAGPRPHWDWASFEYRVAPKPKLRAWRWDEIPIGAAIRLKTQPSIKGVILRTGEDYYVNSVNSIYSSESRKPNILLESWEHSLDFGNTWHPCGVME